MTSIVDSPFREPVLCVREKHDLENLKFDSSASDLHLENSNNIDQNRKSNSKELTQQRKKLKISTKSRRRKKDILELTTGQNSRTIIKSDSEVAGLPESPVTFKDQQKENFDVYLKNTCSTNDNNSSCLSLSSISNNRASSLKKSLKFASRQAKSTLKFSKKSNILDLDNNNLPFIKSDSFTSIILNAQTDNEIDNSEKLIISNKLKMSSNQSHYQNSVHFNNETTPLGPMIANDRLGDHHHNQNVQSQNSSNILMQSKLHQHTNLNPATPVTIPQKYEQVLAKRKKWPLKGWHRRYFVFFKGVLEYGRNKQTVTTGRLHGRIELHTCIMVVKAKKRIISMDSGKTVFHIKATSDIIFKECVKAVRAHIEYARIKKRHLQISINKDMAANMGHEDNYNGRSQFVTNVQGVNKNDDRGASIDIIGDGQNDSVRNASFQKEVNSLSIEDILASSINRIGLGYFGVYFFCLHFHILFSFRPLSPFYQIQNVSINSHHSSKSMT